jgi:hypothetical protein
VFCKVSGLLTEAGSRRSDADLAPVVDHLLEVFGAERLMWGSDWPLLNLAGDYGGWLAQARRLLGDGPAQAVFGAPPRASIGWRADERTFAGEAGSGHGGRRGHRQGRRAGVRRRGRARAGHGCERRSPREPDR